MADDCWGLTCWGIRRVDTGPLLAFVPQNKPGAPSPGPAAAVCWHEPLCRRALSLGGHRGPPSSLFIVWIRCTRGRCLSSKNNLPAPASVSISSHLVQQMYFFYRHTVFLFLKCSLSSRLFQVELLHVVVWQFNADIKTTQYSRPLGSLFKWL